MESENRVDTGGLAARIEALLFASDAPLSVGRISGITGETSTKNIKEALAELERFYRSHGRSFGVVEVAGGYQITTLPEFATTVSMLFKSRRKARLSQAALETLAIITYRQPISRAGVEAIRGVNCDGVLATLTDRELIAITGRGEGVGRPFLYSTTSRFLEYLGLKDIRDIPDMEELEKSLETLDLVPQPEHPAGEDAEEAPDKSAEGTGEEDDVTDEP
jgi:segregation and condensation protein B